MPLGVITYSFASMPLSPFATTRYAKEAGLTTLELKIEHLQQDAGAPGNGKRINHFSPDLRAKYDEWFKTVNIGTYRELRKRYDDLGVKIHILKTAIGREKCREGGAADFWCEVAKELGADTITFEAPAPKSWGKTGPFLAELAKKHGIRFGFHNHLQLTPDTYSGADSILNCSKDIGLCFDIGHFVAANGAEASLEFVKRHHEHIFSYHLKDRKANAPKVQACPYGEGDVPFKELFKLIRREGWIVPGDIELEYGYKDRHTTAAQEVARGAEYLRGIFKEVMA